MSYGSVPNTLSELIRTALIPKQGCRFIVADFSAIEARVLAWLAGEEWVLEEFRGAGKIYEATASRMYHVPKESIIKGNTNYEYRQKGILSTSGKKMIHLTSDFLFCVEVTIHPSLRTGFEKAEEIASNTFNALRLQDSTKLRIRQDISLPSARRARSKFSVKR